MSLPNKVDNVDDAMHLMEVVQDWASRNWFMQPNHHFRWIMTAMQHGQIAAHHIKVRDEATMAHLVQQRSEKSQGSMDNQ